MGYRIKVILGDYYHDNEIDCVQGRCSPPVTVNFATHLYLNAKYRQEPIYRDLALLRLKDNVQYGEFIRPICLPFVCSLKQANHTGIRMTAAGWGKYENRSEHSDYLWKFRGRIVDLEKCKKVYHTDLVHHFQQCLLPDRNKSSCKGDSGGPVMLGTRISTKCRCTVRGIEFPLGPTHYVHYLMAVTSFIPSFCFSSKPDYRPEVHTRIAPFLKWILERLRQ